MDEHSTIQLGFTLEIAKTLLGAGIGAVLDDDRLEGLLAGVGLSGIATRNIRKRLGGILRQFSPLHGLARSPPCLALI